ncbi:histidine kinase [Isoptericola haloaureus]|uniref:Histidine kinase n=1 Tax=Isoptericola haloaureus TaxID=1542902 RepID=A0ABU7Z9M3_9MICO
MSSTPPEQPAETPDAVEETPSEPVDEPASTAADDEHLLVDPARVRRAPRYRAFFTVGAVVGLVVGLVVGTWLTGIAADDEVLLLKPGVFVSVVTLATTTFFVLLAGGLAILADRRSLRRR